MHDVQILSVILPLVVLDAPQFQKGGGETAYRFALQPQSRVLPLSVGMLPVKVLLRQIVAPGKAHLAVNDGDLPMIPVVQEDVQQGKGRVEGPAGNALLHQPFGEEHIHLAHGADIIVQKPDFHPLCPLADENILDFPEAGAVLHNEILHEDEFLRLLQIGLHGLEGILCLGVEMHGGVFIHGPAGAVPKIPGLIGAGQVNFLQLLQCGVSPGGNLVLHILPDGPEPLAHAGIAQHLNHQIQAQTHHRQHQNQHDPGHLHGGVGVLAVQAQHHQNTQNGGHQGQCA